MPKRKADRPVVKPKFSRGRHKSGWKIVYKTKYGDAILGNSKSVLEDEAIDDLRGQVQLIFTSPPFPLLKKKSYGNLQGEEYLDWLSSYGPSFKQLLRPDGSIVIEIGNAWEPGIPAMSTLPTRALLRFLEANNLHLCQEFICHNPSRLPTPAAWVTIRRLRVKDSFTRLWWMSPTPYPKANNRNVLQEYSEGMKRLLKSRQYNHGRRPSEHVISATSFLTSNGGAIPPNVFTMANTASNDRYQQFCKDHSVTTHPARMQPPLADFFIKFLTSPGDLVLDPFAGSNTTGASAEALKRRWVSIEANPDYLIGSLGRFERLPSLTI